MARATEKAPQGAPKPPRKRKPSAEGGSGNGTKRVRVGTPVAGAPVRRRSPLLVLALVAAVTMAVDQLSKWVVVHRLDLPTKREIDVIDPFLNLRMAWNEGMNFGLMASGDNLTRWLLIAIAAVVCVWVTVWVIRARPGRLAAIAAGLLVGGAIGNVIDRLAYGAVADFLNMSLPGWTNPYSFNVADISIFAGAIGLVLQPGGDKPRDEAAKTG